MIFGFMTFIVHAAGPRGQRLSTWSTDRTDARTIASRDHLQHALPRARPRRSSIGSTSAALEAVAAGLAEVRDAGGRLFILGVGGSAGHASHAVNDFRKICGFEAYAPTDNVSELTARDQRRRAGTRRSSSWLKGSRLARRRRAPRLLGRRRRTASRRSRRTWCARSSTAREARRARSSASWAATAGTPREVADACVVIPVARTPSASRRTPRGSARWSGTCS